MKPFESENFDIRDPNAIYPQRFAVAQEGMVASQHYLATEAGSKILQEGGNAIDAAIATAFALGVCEPAASGLGGQTMMLININNKQIALDGSSHAPFRVEPGSIEKKMRLRGYLATTIPSTPAVLAYALERYGTKSLTEILQPAIEIAERGYFITPLQHFLTKRELIHLQSHNGGKFFLNEKEQPHPVGSLFQQPVLANTLKQLAQAGIEDFYQGEIADLIVKDMQENGGLIQHDDLAQIPWPIEREPLQVKIDCALGELNAYTIGPPGAGTMLVQMLEILNTFSLQDFNPDASKDTILLAEIIRKANLDRVVSPLDPQQFPQDLNAGKTLLDPENIHQAAQEVLNNINKGETTHLSVMDKQGNAVALTQSIERVYGSFCASPKLGFLYNNYMSAFNTENIAHPYYLRPNGVPMASVAPTIIFKNKQPWLTIGSPGSERIVSSILQVLIRIIKGKTPFEAVNAPRIHCSSKGKVSLEASRMRSDIPLLLKKQGFDVDIRDAYSFYLGCVQLVQYENNEFIGVADPRRDGSAGGV